MVDTKQKKQQPLHLQKKKITAELVVPVVETQSSTAIEDVIQPVVELVTESVVEVAVEPVVEPVVESVVEPVVEHVTEQQVEITKVVDTHKIDITGLTKDLAENRYFRIFEREAQVIAEKMINEGSESLHDVKWFLALSERIKLAKELKQKYGLS